MQDFLMDTALQTSNNIPGRVAVWALTENGRQLGETLCRHVKHAQLYVSARLGRNLFYTTRTEPVSPGGEQASCLDGPMNRPGKAPRVFHRLSDAVAAQFHKYDCHVFVFSTGIAVRILAPLLVSKLTDPAVVVLDDKGGHAVSLVSGHIGHGNQYARQIAHLLGATPVITTATDVNHRPAMVATAVFSTRPWVATAAFDPLEDTLHSVAATLVGFCFALGVLAVGIGCNRHTPPEVLLAFYRTVLNDAGISPHSVFMLASSDIKKDEPGILSLAESLNLPIQFYDNTRLSSVKTIQNPSKTVEKHIGVQSVCEAAAILASHNGTLILPKQKNADVTLAIALQETGCMS